MDSSGSLFVFRNEPLWALIHHRKFLGHLFYHQLLRRTLLVRVNAQLSGSCVTQFRVNDNAEIRHEDERNVEAQFREIYPRQLIQACDLEPQPQFYPSFVPSTNEYH